MSEVLTDRRGHRLEWITCVTCGNRALVRAGGKGFCSKKCIRGINKNQKYAWKGDEAGYSGFHRRVYRARGKADHCERCGADGAAQRYEWANLTVNYGDVWDYQQMCVPCHREYDVNCRPRGSESPNARLTEEVVRIARVRYSEGERAKALAAEFGVSAATMQRAILRQSWKHVV